MCRRIFAGLGLVAAAVAGLLRPATASGQVPLSRYDWPLRWQMNEVNWNVPPSNSYSPPSFSGPTYYPAAPAYAARPYYYVGPSYYTAYPSYSLSSPVARDDRVLLDVHLPTPDARVWFNGAPTRQAGFERLFESPRIEPGQDYRYTVRARWTENGRPVEQTRTVAVRAGERVDVDFTGRR